MNLILRWIISAAAVWVAVRYVPGITLQEGIAPLFASRTMAGMRFIGRGSLLRQDAF